MHHSALPELPYKSGAAQTLALHQGQKQGHGVCWVFSTHYINLSIECTSAFCWVCCSCGSIHMMLLWVFVAAGVQAAD